MWFQMLNKFDQKEKDISENTFILEIEQETGEKHEVSHNAKKSKEVIIKVGDRKG